MRMRLLALAMFVAVGFLLMASTGEEEKPSGGEDDSASGDCTTKLADKIATASADSTVTLDACTYREKVIIDKSITLVGQEGTKIKGTDVWTGWSGRVSTNTVPIFATDTECQAGTSECSRPEQVFLDSEYLTQVASSPASGQFALDSARRVVLGDEPAGRTVEVTTRDGWVLGAASGVTIDNVDMIGSANSRSGLRSALDNGGYANWTVKNSDLSYGHASVVSMWGNTGLTLQKNVIHHGGQLGVHSYKASLGLYNNTIHTNNIADYDSSWEAGGVKAAAGSNGVWDGNTVYGNDGTALWCDEECDGITISNNTLHHNEKSGIFYEISRNGTIYNNIIYENGWTYGGGLWAAALRATNCDGCEIYANTVAWNQAGIGILHTDRSEQPYTRNNYVHDNFVYMKDYPSSLPFSSCNRQLALGYCGEFGSNNQGSGNKYYYPAAESSAPRYHYNPSEYSSLASFNATLGEEGGTYMTTAQKDANLSALGIPTSPSS